MIVRVQGSLEAVGPDWVYINLGGVTLQVFVPTSAISELGPQGSQVSLFTHLRIRDDQPVLYGFTDLGHYYLPCRIEFRCAEQTWDKLFSYKLNYCPFKFGIFVEFRERSGC